MDQTEASRLSVVESQLSDAREDIKDIKLELHDFHTKYTDGQKGMSRPEKIALTAALSAVGGMVLTAIALLSGNV